MNSIDKIKKSLLQYHQFELISNRNKDMSDNDMKTFTIYYNNLDIDNKRKVVTIEKDCPRLVHLSKRPENVFNLAKLFVKSGEWKTWFCPELVKDEGYVLKSKD